MKSISTYEASFWSKAMLGTVVLLGLVLSFQPAAAIVVSPVQSTAQPYGLTTAGPVNIAGSDAASAEFLQALPSILTKLNTLLPEYKVLANPSSMALDPVSLKLSADATVRIYFVKEGASYHSTLGINVLTELPTASTPGITPGAELIFPDVSSSAPGNLNSTGNSVRTNSEPLIPGDFVELGHLEAGSLLDFFLIPYGATGGKVVLTDETSRNSDNLQHVVTFSMPNSPYLFFAFEDAPNGGDRDYNDAVFALQVSYTPEPGTWAGMAGLSLFVGISSLRRRKKVVAAMGA